MSTENKDTNGDLLRLIVASWADHYSPVDADGAPDVIGRRIARAVETMQRVMVSVLLDEPIRQYLEALGIDIPAREAIDEFGACADILRVATGEATAADVLGENLNRPLGFSLVDSVVQRLRVKWYH